MGRSSRAVAIALCVLLIGANGAVCAGWTATPAARMACCTDECPMHKAESDESPSPHVLTQAEADACCAVSERTPSDSSSPTAIVTISAAVLGTGVVLPANVPVRVLADGWRTEAPAAIPPVPRHVLLSVFLV